MRAEGGRPGRGLASSQDLSDRPWELSRGAQASVEGGGTWSDLVHVVTAIVG